MMQPKLMLLMSEVWTMTDARDLRGLAELAVVAERAGVDGIMIGEHVVMGPNAGYNGVPENPRDWLGEGTHVPEYAHPNGLHILGAIATLTTRIRLLAASIISPLRHPLVLGKELATVDLIAEGRLIFVPTVSWQEEEYAAVGVPFRRRGVMLDEQLEVWERAWRDETVSYDGTQYRFDGVHFEPKAWRPTGPQLWIGGMQLHAAALRRAVRYASGYFPVLPPSTEDIARLHEGLLAAGRPVQDIELAMLVGLDTPFPDATSTKPLGPALDNAQPHMADGVSTFVLKPSQYIDDREQLGDFCRDAIAGLTERAADLG